MRHKEMDAVDAGWAWKELSRSPALLWPVGLIRRASFQLIRQVYTKQEEGYILHETTNWIWSVSPWQPLPIFHKKKEKKEEEDLKRVRSCLF